MTATESWLFGIVIALAILSTFELWVIAQAHKLANIAITASINEQARWKEILSSELPDDERRIWLAGLHEAERHDEIDRMEALAINKLSNLRKKNKK